MLAKIQLILVKVPLRVLYFLVQHEYTVLLLICWFCVGGLLVLSSAIRCEELNSTLYEGRIIAQCATVHAFKYSSNKAYNEINRVVRVIAL